MGQGSVLNCQAREGRKDLKGFLRALGVLGGSFLIFAAFCAQHPGKRRDSAVKCSRITT
jgi:hypothetical protein